MLSMGHEIVWLARNDGLKVVPRTINLIYSAPLLIHARALAVFFYARGTR